MTKQERQEMKERALQKMVSYCRSHPRSHYEIKGKLYTMGLWKLEINEILSYLIENNHVSEERFARKYTSGRLVKDNWGKEKIKQGLIQQHVSEYNIKHVLNSIDEDEYKEKLYEMARKKWDSIKGVEVDQFIKAKKTCNYLLYKGYEAKLVYQVLRELKSSEA